ncbi:MAG TPA: T9SS type A sorting domain-containing protein [bacterium]|jgi:hypothetical protein
MRQILLPFALVLVTGCVLWAQPVPIDTFLVLAEGDTDRFWMQVPDQYASSAPPAILIWWHQLGGTQYEMRDYTRFDDLANQHGWIAASHFGPNDRHWDTRKAQDHCRAMLDWIMQRYPFSRDSIYMIGGSMGGAAGQVWHNNHCGISDYLIAASAGGSQILDCQLRQEQYLASGDTNRSMRTAFGGVPGDPDSAAFLYEYHRYSAVHLRDTTQSMHFNSLHLPVYNTWGSTDFEWQAYGYPAQAWDTLRINSSADTTVCQPSGIPGHGLEVLTQDSVVRWLSGFSVNRFPRDLSINADEDDEYYWTRVTLASHEHTFGRYGATQDFAGRRLDIHLLRNIASVEIEFAFPWPDFDSLSGIWQNDDSSATPTITVTLRDVPAIRSVQGPDGEPVPFSYMYPTATIAVGHSGHYSVLFEPQRVEPRGAATPAEMRLVSAYPNPFNSQITLEIECSGAVRQAIRIYDITGRAVKTVEVALNPGVQRVMVSGEGLASGVYFVATGRNGQSPLKIVLLK